MRSLILYMILFVNPVFKPKLNILHTLRSNLFEHNNFIFHRYITYWNSFKIPQGSCMWYIYIFQYLFNYVLHVSISSV